MNSVFSVLRTIQFSTVNSVVNYCAPSECDRLGDNDCLNWIDYSKQTKVKICFMLGNDKDKMCHLPLISYSQTENDMYLSE